MENWNFKVQNSPQEIIEKLESALASAGGFIFNVDANSALFKIRKPEKYPDQILHRNRIIVNGKILNKNTENTYSEKQINDFGYDLMQEKNYQDALTVFKLNTELYPDGWNTYDSYGEMLLKIGDKENALKAYKKSLVLNPDNENAKKVVSEIK